MSPDFEARKITCLTQKSIVNSGAYSPKPEFWSGTAISKWILEFEAEMPKMSVLIKRQKYLILNEVIIYYEIINF